VAVFACGAEWSAAEPLCAIDVRRAPDVAWTVSDGQVTHGYGVAVQPNALCCWTADADGITLTLDVRAGGAGVRLGGRTLEACTVLDRVGAPGESAFQAGAAFCRMMCPHPRLPKEPVYGFNDWYCAYGVNTGTNFLADAAFVVSLIPEAKNRPYLVMDDGWQVNPPARQGVSGFSARGTTAMRASRWTWRPSRAA